MKSSMRNICVTSSKQKFLKVSCALSFYEATMGMQKSVIIIKPKREAKNATTYYLQQLRRGVIYTLIFILIINTPGFL